MYTVNVNSDNPNLIVGNVFFTSDTHYNHANIIKLCNRPFSSANEMNEALIANWNSVVEPTDIVFHLGDVTLSGLGAAKRFFSAVNGKVFVLTYPQHHDKYWLDEIGQSRGYAKHMTNAEYKELGKVSQYILTLNGGQVNLIDQIPTVTVSDKRAEHIIAMCHYPIANWPCMYHGAWHLHGHTHGIYQGNGKSMDVGVDSNNFTPVSYASVCKFMENR